MLKKIKKLFKTKTEFPENFITKEEIISYLLSKKIVILEAGACGGDDTLAWSKLLPKAQIHSFEPVPVNFEALKTKTRKCKNVKLYNLALNDKTSEIKMYVSLNTLDQSLLAHSSSILKPQEMLNTHAFINFDEEITVQAMNLDEWALKNNVKKIDLMWLDMQGAEYNVLKAAPNILSQVKVIYTEVNHLMMYENILLYEDFKNWLESQGFTEVKKENIYPDQNNALFVRK